MVGQIQSWFVCQQKVLQLISTRPGSSNSKDSTNSSQGPTQEEFLTLKSKCQASLAATTDLEQYRQGLIQTLKQFGDQENEETEDAILSDDSYVDLSLSFTDDLWVNLDKRFQESFVQLYICTIVSLYLSSKKKNVKPKNVKSM